MMMPTAGSGTHLHPHQARDGVKQPCSRKGLISSSRYMGLSVDELPFGLSALQVVSRLAVDSSDMFLAAATDTGAVLLYRRKDGEYRMEFAGRCKAHSAPIVGLCFGESPAGKTRLFSLGEHSLTADARHVSIRTICLSHSAPTV